MQALNDENYYKSLMDLFNYGDPFPDEMGVTVTECRDGFAKAELTLMPGHLNTIRPAHGGVAYTLADTATGCAACTRGQHCTTVEGNLNYIRAAREGDQKLIATANVIHFGRRTIVLSCEITNDSDKLIATGLFTYCVIRNPGEDKIRENK